MRISDWSSDVCSSDLVIDINYAPSQYSLEGAIQHICDEAVAAVRAGKVILVLSDRPLERDELPVHALLATGAVNNRLVHEGLRCDCNIVVETATARDRSEERRVGKARVSTCRSRWSSSH